MITDAEKEKINAQAYVPEHSVELMTRVSGGEPFLIDDFFCIHKDDLVIVVGYSLEGNSGAGKLSRAIERVVKIFRPVWLSVAAESLPSSFPESCERASDYYYTLILRETAVRARLQKVVAAAREHAAVERANSLGKDHWDLAQEFIRRIDPPRKISDLMLRMWEYVGHSKGSLVLNAWGSNSKLAAFYVIDLSPKEFSTYVIGCHSKKNYVRWASDLLFSEMISVSQETGKKYIHLGLGVNDGIRRFKEKWGGKPGLRYEMCEFRVRKPSFLDAIRSYPTNRQR
jgi:hypothetical protein